MQQVFLKIQIYIVLALTAEIKKVNLGFMGQCKYFHQLRKSYSLTGNGQLPVKQIQILQMGLSRDIFFKFSLGPCEGVEVRC